MKKQPYTLERGTTPLLVSVPHAGGRIPDDLQDRYVDRALAVEDSDWHLDRVYAFARALGAGMIVPAFSRYVIDLNRPPDDTPMYPGANNTELCPTHFFTGDPLYRDGRAPDTAEISRRREIYWRPYHAALEGELGRLRAEHGHAIVFDGHSIMSRLPWLFEGRLPDLNLGTVDGRSCAPSLRRAMVDVLEQQRDFTHVVDGRFKGGYITRHYGRPAQRQHAIQLEMCFACYMQECAPFAYEERHVARARPVLEALVRTMLDWMPPRGG